jgi:hypothetical protein
LKTQYPFWLPNIILFFGILLLGIACADKPETVGLDLLDQNKPFVGSDTVFELSAYSVTDDSVLSDETSVNLLGSIYSETFGRSNSSIYTQIRISSLNPEWGENPVADSVIFSLVYDGYYGNLLTEQTVRAYRILEDLYRDSTYWSNVSFDTETEELAVHTFLPDLTEVPDIDTGGGTPDTTFLRAVLRIPMDLSFADYMFGLDTSQTSSSEAFLEAFKGIYLRNDNVNAAGDGAILYFDLLDDRSNVTMYYHNDTEDSLSFRFFINLNNARVGRFEHEYELSTDPNFLAQIIDGDTTSGTENLYLHGMGGVKTEIRFTGLNDWASETNRIINEARLIIDLEEMYDEDYEPSTSLILFQKTATGSFDFLDDQLQGELYFNGKYDNAANGYFFRISLHLQSLMAGQPDLGVALFSNAKSVKATELKLHGTNPQNPNRLRLQITYTDIE